MIEDAVLWNTNNFYNNEMFNQIQICVFQLRASHE
jgi:hypothetical protein